MIDKFELPHRILVNDPIGRCGMTIPHKPHSWARVDISLGQGGCKVLDPYQCPGIHQIDWPITGMDQIREEIRRHYLYGARLTTAERDLYKITNITNG